MGRNNHTDDEVPRSFVADPDQGALFSPKVIDGARPWWAYREPADEADSGWRFFEGNESDDWLNEPGNCVLQHLGHVVDQWPELRRIVKDDRVRSAWAWNPLLRRYREVHDWTWPGDEEQGQQSR
jgi:hypothetical protein